MQSMNVYLKYESKNTGAFEVMAFGGYAGYSMGFKFSVIFCKI